MQDVQDVQPYADEYRAGERKYWRPLWDDWGDLVAGLDDCL
jgi:hypothetical protein